MIPVTGMYWLKVDKMLPGTEAFDAPPIDGHRPRSGKILFKPQYGVGHWFRGCVEPIIFFKKPGVPSLRINEIGLISPNGQHSRKPNSLHEMIENSSLPFSRDGYIELFARRKRKGWICLGKDVDGRDIRESLAALISPVRAKRSLRGRDRPAI